MNKSNKRSVIAFAAMIAVLVVMLFSSVYIAEHTEHQCTGANCPICATLEQCQAQLKQLAGAVFFFICMLSILVTSVCNIEEYKDNILNDSLVRKKVRIND